MTQNLPQWLTKLARTPSLQHRQHAEERQNQLLKPLGSLGILEQLAIRLAALQATETPAVDNLQMAVFVADHGVAQESVSAFPQWITITMLEKFIRGEAAIAVQARLLGAPLCVINLGMASTNSNSLPEVEHRVLGNGSANFCEEPAMSIKQVHDGLAIGRDIVSRHPETQMFIAGEMGIGNTTTATALCSAILQCPPQRLVGRGSGIDAGTISHKLQVIKKALTRHHDNLTLNDIGITLSCLGGFDIVAMCGAYIAAAQQGIVLLVDGFIATTAALVALRINPSIAPWLIFSHCSAEAGHRVLLQTLGVRPLIALDMRLGEGSGAATAVPLLRMACALHNQMGLITDIDKPANIS